MLGQNIATVNLSGALGVPIQRKPNKQVPISMAIGAPEFGLCSEEGKSEFLQLAIYPRFLTTFNIKVHVGNHKPSL